jgi:hypothetical protein
LEADSIDRQSTFIVARVVFALACRKKIGRHVSNSLEVAAEFIQQECSGGVYTAAANRRQAGFNSGRHFAHRDALRVDALR